MDAHSDFLVIDDDDINNFVCKLLIKGITGTDNVKAFTSPEKGIEYIENEYTKSDHKRKTLVLLDINMPCLSGWEVLKIFDKFSETVKKQFSIYILSSCIRETEIAKILANKYAKGCIEKPLTSEKLSELMLGLSAN
ncbi:MAG: response regulator [Bacteroidota bacterium]|nr:response regulator [Bacteroidota bacterium]